jgi:hypothetical protein
MPVASPPVSGFVFFGSLAGSNCPANPKVAGSVTRPNWVYITLQLAGLPFEASSSLVRLLPPTLDWLHVEQAIHTVNSLSVHKIRQAFLALQRTQSHLKSRR